jgi:hypothetical protein
LQATACAAFKSVSILRRVFLVGFRQNADDVCLVFFDAFASPVSFQFVGDRSGFADADQRVMPAFISVGFAFRDNINRRNRLEFFAQLENLKVVALFFAAKDRRANRSGFSVFRFWRGRLSRFNRIVKAADFSTGTTFLVFRFGFPNVAAEMAGFSFCVRLTTFLAAASDLIFSAFLGSSAFPAVFFAGTAR